MRVFEDFISEANLMDLPLHGRKYTLSLNVFQQQLQMSWSMEARRENSN